MTRWLVCGSRTFDRYEVLRDELDKLVADRGKPSVVINGGMIGADALSSFWAYERKINTECYGAAWGTWGGKAGPIRNRLMLRDGEPGLVVAFFDARATSSRGTLNMVNIARQAHVEVVEVHGT